MSTHTDNIKEKIKGWNGFTVFRHVDFRLLWISTMVSFMGSQIQNVAQGYYVYELTGSEFKLGLVQFCGMFPITVLGPFVAVLADIFDRRKALYWTTGLFVFAASFLAIAAFTNSIQYWHFIAISLLSGFVVTVDQPTRQAIVRSVVPREDLSSAIPVQGMTFNLARSIGPALAGLLISFLGPAICFALNALATSALVIAAVKIKSNLKPAIPERQPIKDLIFEGMLYTWRNPSLKTLFFMEGATSLFGIFYLTQLPAIAKELLGLDAKGLGAAYSAVGLGALVGLVSLSSMARRRVKPLVIRIAMSIFGLMLFLLSTVTIPILAFPILALMGASTIAQFNTTNALFQIIAPQRLQGRVLAMHMWAVAGLAPVGTLSFGFIAEHLGLRTALVIASVLVSIMAVYGWMNRHKVVEPEISIDEEPEQSTESPKEKPQPNSPTS